MKTELHGFHSCPLGDYSVRETPTGVFTGVYFSLRFGKERGKDFFPDSSNPTRPILTTFFSIGLLSKSC